MAEPEACPFCRTEINAGATVCAACGAFKDRRMGCLGGAFLFLAVMSSLGALGAMLVRATGQVGNEGLVVASVYGLGAIICWLVFARRYRVNWFRRM